uniref:Uncharacterized protein n=1 Tax=Arundo donax TaxID=35708 RepID=A0A0A9D5G8_ARUDO
MNVRAPMNTMLYVCCCKKFFLKSFHCSSSSEKDVVSKSKECHQNLPNLDNSVANLHVVTHEHFLTQLAVLPNMLTTN